MRPTTIATALAAGALVVGAALAPSLVGAADHLDAPAVADDGRTDINDLYAFQSPNDPDSTVLIMTVNPLAGIVSGTTFRPGADYTVNIDQNGDAVADVTASVKFTGVTAKGQKFKLTADGPPDARGVVGETSTIKGGGSITAGVFDDPFFFDLAGFQDGLNFTGDDTLAGTNVSAIVIEVPSSWVNGGGDTNVGIWATTTVDGVQIDRTGRPAINTVLIPSDRKDEFNATSPADDPALFGDDVRATITALSGDADFAAVLTGILLPDVLTFDTANSAGFLNGRQLADDVIDAELDLLTQGALTGDGVDANDVGFQDTFPYLAPAHG